MQEFKELVECKVRAWREVLTRGHSDTIAGRLDAVERFHLWLNTAAPITQATSQDRLTSMIREYEQMARTRGEHFYTAAILECTHLIRIVHDGCL